MDLNCYNDCTHNLLYVNVKQMVFTAILSFVILGVLAFILPNFYHITYEPLLGFAAFVSVLSLILSLILWYFTRNWRKKRQEKNIKKNYPA